MNCPNCGTQLAETAKFCLRCGTKIEQLPAEQPDVQETASSIAPRPPVADAPVAEPATYDPQDATVSIARPAQPVAAAVVAEPVSYAPTYNYTAAPVAHSAPAAKPRKKLSAGAKVGVVLLSILLFILSVAALLIYEVRTIATNKQSIEAIIDGADVIEVVDELDIVYEDTLEKFKRDMNYKYGLDVDDESLEKFIDRSEFKPYFAKKTASFLEDVLAGEDSEIVVEKADIIEMLREDDDLVDKYFGRSLNHSTREDIAFWVMGKADETVAISTEDLEDEEPVVYSVVVACFSYITLAVVVALIAIVIFFMMRISATAGMCGTGIVFTIIGVLTVIVANVLGKFVLGNTAVGAVAGELAATNIVINAIVLAVGVALIVARTIIVKIRRSK